MKRYSITNTQWDLIDPICKTMNAAGEPCFLEFDDVTKTVTPVRVELTDTPQPVDVPVYYASMWPSDPRD